MRKTIIITLIIAQQLFILHLLSTKEQAQPIRLVGFCSGQFYGAMEEDQFPRCDWIETPFIAITTPEQDAAE